MLQGIVAAIGLVGVTSLLTSCGPSGSRPPRHCETAKECADIKTRFNESCAASPEREESPIGQQGRNFVQAYNFHSEKNILAVVKIRTEFLNRETADNIAYKPIRLLAQPKGNVSGGPEDKDRGGQPVDLGCEYVMKGDHLDHYLFSIESACFEDDSNCTVSPPPGAQKPTEDVLASCEEQCAQPNGSCVSYRLKNTNPTEAAISGEMYKMSHAMRQAYLPFSAPIEPLISILGGPLEPCRKLLLHDLPFESSAGHEQRGQ